MSDGGWQSRKGAEHDFNLGHIKKKRSGIKDFAHAMARIAVAQICESAGFQGFQQSALDTFADAAIRYIGEIGKTSNSYASLACRSQCNVFDVIQGLEDLGSVQGFSGASDFHHCLLGSGTVLEIARYVEEAKEIPFAFAFRGFPIVKERNPNVNFTQSRESSVETHIPPWLPMFPDPETYINMHQGEEKASKTKGVEVEQAGKYREVGGALANFPQQMTSGRSEPIFGGILVGSFNGKGSVKMNPFLVPPVQFGEKEVASVVRPTKVSNEKAYVQHLMDDDEANHVSVLGTSPPVVEAVKNGKHGSEDVPSNQRNRMQFKFGSGKKSSAMVSAAVDDGFGKITAWCGNDSWEGVNEIRSKPIQKKLIESSEELDYL